MDTYQMIMAVVMGLALAAAAGFRVFVPLLALSLASKAGIIGLDPGMTWIASTPAVICLSVATVAEIVAYKVPWVDNALDTVATPSAVIAGSVIAASQFGFIGDQGQLLKWGAAIIAGGGLAGLIQVGTVALRAASLGFTGGLGNPVIGLAESGAAITVSLLAVFAAIIAGVMVLALVLAMVAVLLHLRSQRAAREAARVAVRA
jgi:hypothetical protein